MSSKKWFGPSRAEIWRKLAEELNARYTESGWNKNEKVQVEHDEWTVTLDSFIVMAGQAPITFTRFRAPFINPEGFRFRIHHRNIFTGIKKMFGMQDIEIGHEKFDNDFVIQSNNEKKILELLANDRIREILSSEPALEFRIVDDEGWFGTKYPKDTDSDSLFVSTGGEIKDIQRLKKLFDLFAETLEEMCRIGVAYHQSPNLEL